MVISSFSIKEKEKKSCFFKEIFLLADISIDITLEMSFLNTSNDENDFFYYHIY